MARFEPSKIFALKAKVSTGALVIQEGAVYEGQLEMAGIELAAPKPLRSRASIAPVSIDAASNEKSSGSGTTYIRRLGSPETPWQSQQETSTERDAPEMQEMD